MKSDNNPKDENEETEQQKCKDFVEKQNTLNRQKALKKHRSDKEYFYKRVLKPGQTKEQFKEKSERKMKEHAKLFDKYLATKNMEFPKTPKHKPKDARDKAYIKKLKKEEMEYQNKRFRNDLDTVDVKGSATGDLKENKIKYKP
jgi:hypothetical protein